MLGNYDTKQFSKSAVVVKLVVKLAVVVQWSAFSPSTPTFRVRNPLTPTVYSLKFVFEKNEIKETG